MGTLVEFVEAKCKEELDRVTNEIFGELRAECPVRSGEARNSIVIEPIAPWANFVGSSHPHLFFADQGNNQRYSYFGGKRNPYMPNYSGRGSRALYFDGEWHYMASTYEGKHFVAEVASRHQ